MVLIGKFSVSSGWGVVVLCQIAFSFCLKAQSFTPASGILSKLLLDPSSLLEP